MTKMFFVFICDISLNGSISLLLLLYCVYDVIILVLTNIKRCLNYYISLNGSISFVLLLYCAYDVIILVLTDIRIFCNNYSTLNVSIYFIIII